MNINLQHIDPISPSVLEAPPPGDRLNVQNDVYMNEHITVRAPQYPGMAIGHRLTVRWVTGRYKFDTATQTVTETGAFDFLIPRWLFVDSIGSLATINYSIRLPNQPLIPSRTLTLQVDAQQFNLTEPRLSADQKRVTVKFLGQTTGYTVKVRWHGVVVRNTETKPILDSASIPFDIPDSWLKENAGKTVRINYSVYLSGSGKKLMFSQVLTVNL
ncbi:hypothetical protein ACIOZM_19915 [Pseudomonas sp. NPDC087346]|uniref:hypothetical protein n=1 Tax=Pseudomonas sp. NPDC087346 TaxID=3364438 RepID=UPI0038172360